MLGLNIEDLDPEFRRVIGKGDVGYVHWQTGTAWSPDDVDRLRSGLGGTQVG